MARRRSHVPVPAAVWWALLGGALAAVPGALPRAEGGWDPLALVAYLTLVAPAVGVLMGARGVRLLPLGLAVPAVWMVLLVQVDLSSTRDLPAALGAGGVFTGLYLAGLGLGGLAPGRAWPLAGAALLAGPFLVGLGLAGGLLGGEGTLAVGHPGVQSWLLELSPLAVAFDGAGWDWAHANPLAYRLGGVEWVARGPWDGRLAGAVFGVLGCAAAWLLPRLSGDHRAGPVSP